MAEDSETKNAAADIPSWTCEACTFHHIGKTKQLYLACELCQSARSAKNKRKVVASSSSSQVATTLPQHINASPPTPSAAWGSLRPPSDRDVQGPRKRRKALDAPPPLLDYLVVMDLEWTADDKRKMLPIAEITQLPSVVMKLVEKTTHTPRQDVVFRQRKSLVELPSDLTLPSFPSTTVKADAYAISAFDTFVRPTLNPTLTQFSINLTAITQKNVDVAPTIDVALQDYMQWLTSLDLVDSNGIRKGNWCFATWGDVDIMSTLRQEIAFKSLNLPSCFDRWINLKHDSIFKKHYGREPRGGLRFCVESVGAIWHGRAHNGLIDSLNTAKIVRDMVQTGFRFTRPTRGLDKNGVPFGQKKQK